MALLNSDKALPMGYVLEWGRYPYRIDKLVSSDGLGFTYRATVLSPEAQIKDVVVREFFMVRCCYRGDDGAEMLCDEEIEATVADTLTRHAQNLIRRREVAKDYPSLVCILDIFEANGTYYHVGECVEEGLSLERYIEKNGPLEPAKVREILLPVCNAVRHLHSSHILHTDICPATIMMRDGKGVLTHLYASKQFNSDGEEDVILPALQVRDGYAAPELYGPVENFLPQIDIYSIAATIIYCITGKTPPPSIELTEEKLLKMLPKNLPNTFVSALFHAMLADINERTSSISVFRSELDINYQLTHESAEPAGVTRVSHWWDKVKHFFRNMFPLHHGDNEEHDEEDDEEIEINVDALEASMNAAYPRLIVIGGITIFVIIALLILMFIVF